MWRQEWFRRVQSSGTTLRDVSTMPPGTPGAEARLFHDTGLRRRRVL